MPEGGGREPAQVEEGVDGCVNQGGTWELPQGDPVALTAEGAGTVTGAWQAGTDGIIAHINNKPGFLLLGKKKTV